MYFGCAANPLPAANVASSKHEKAIMHQKLLDLHFEGQEFQNFKVKI
jgi:hypothetical protein